MKLENIMLNEINQSQKDKYCMISPIRVIKYSQTHRSKEQDGGFQGLGGKCGVGSVCIKVQLCKMSKFYRSAVQHCAYR